MIRQVSMTVAEIAERVQGEVSGDPNLLITGVGSIEDAGEGDIIFAENEKLLKKAMSSRARAVIASRNGKTGEKAMIRVDKPKLAFIQVMGLFAPVTDLLPGIHPTAVVGERVQMGKHVAIGALAVVEDEVVLGDEVVIHALVHIGRQSKISEGTVLHPCVCVLHDVTIGRNVIIHSGSVIGSDGFGYLCEEGKHRKMPQIGTVVIEDHVEIGANCTVDRATTGATVIGAGTKMDNLVHVAHNVSIGRDCVICGQVGISGSTRMGDRVMLAGQVGLSDHVTIGEDARIGAQSGVINDVPAGSFYSGFPARPHGQKMRAEALSLRLPQMVNRLRDLEQRIKELETELKAGEDKG